MNLQNQIRLSVFISFIIAIVISVSIGASYQNVLELQRQESLAADTVRGGYELTYLTNDYIVNAEPRAIIQWEARYASLQPIINQLEPGNNAERDSIGTIRDYDEKIANQFHELAQPGAIGNGTGRFSPEYQQMIWSRNNVPLQGLIYEAWHLRFMYNDDVTAARFWNNILVIVLIVAMLIIISINYLLISRRLMQSIREVNTGSEVFATGNLDYRIPVITDDEIGGIAQRLNTMAGQIRTVTASRDDLDREVSERRKAEESLRETNEYLRNLITYANAPIIVWNPDLKITRFNNAFEKLTGRSRDDVTGKDLEILFPENTRPETLAKIRQTSSGERWEVVEIPILHISGKVSTVLWNSAAIRNPSGTIISTIAQGQDITDRKRAEEQITTSEIRYHRLFESAKDGILILNRDTGEIIDANPFIEDLLGYEPKDFLGKHLWDIGLLKDQLLSKIAFEDLQAKDYLRYEDLPLQTKGGQIIEVEFVSNIYRIDPGTTVIQCNIRDITDRKRDEKALREKTTDLETAYEKITASEEELRESYDELAKNRETLAASEEKYRALSESTTDIIFINGLDGTFRYVNRTGADLLGHSPEDFVGKMFVDFFPPETAAIQLRLFSEAARTRQPASEEMEVEIPGELRWYDVREIPLFAGDGSISAVMGTVRDITDRKRAEEEVQRKNTDLEAANQEIRATGEELQRLNNELDERVRARTAELEAAYRDLESFTYSVSHDLRAPLRAIHGFSNILLEEYQKDLSPEVQRYLTMINENGLRMGNLIDALLTLARTGRQSLKVQVVHPGEIIRQCLMEQHEAQEGRNVGINVAELPPCLADPALLQRVWFNLIANALKFTRKREVAQITIGSFEKEGEIVYFIRDNGAGFDMKYAGKLFGVFQRLHRVDEFEGNGVGLAIVKMIVTRHGGRVWAEAEVEKGATFFFTLGKGDVKGDDGNG
ncbi:MAG: PAS domain S-box protein [Methanoregula sp.]